MRHSKNRVALSGLFMALLLLSGTRSFADVEHLDDVIITGSACIGFDCVNGENFGFDTLRLKENNLRIKADDTSNSASFPANDWQITFNETSNGGLNKFSIDDVTGSRTPFTIEAGAPSHSLYVDDGGRIGFGTNAPVVELHVKDGDTPTLRLEQDGSSGFAAQTWDVAGNETNFFVRDVTTGSRLPFKIRPGAPSDALVVGPTGQVGIGVGNNPTEELHLRSVSGPTKILFSTPNGAQQEWALNNTGGAFRIATPDTPWTELSIDPSGKLGVGVNTPTEELHLEAESGPTKILMDTTNSSGVSWALNNTGYAFRIATPATAQQEFSIDPAGNVTISGTISTSSDRNSKTNIEPVDDEIILQKLMDMEIHRWEYTHTPGVVHLGPMAQDFHAAFGLGEDDRHITPTDTTGVAMGAIRGLYKELQQKDAQIQQLTAMVEELSSQVAEIKATSP